MATNRPRELRILTADVPNPHHDKRRRYGTDAKATFTKGTVFLYLPTHKEPGMPYADYAQAIAYGRDGRSWDLGGNNAEALLHVSAPHTARTWGDAMCREGWGREAFANVVLERLIASGAVPLERAMVEFYAYMAEPEETPAA